jgi:di/tricarboxylate transporter
MSMEDPDSVVGNVALHDVDEFDSLWDAPPPVAAANRRVRLRAWLLRNKVYAASVVVLFSIAVTLGAAPGALDLNNIAAYSTPSSWAKRVRVELLLDAQPASLNATALLIDPLMAHMSGMASVVVRRVDMQLGPVLNFSLANTTAVAATLHVVAAQNFTGRDIEHAYGTASIYGPLRSVDAVLLSSSFLREQQFTAASAWLTLLSVVFILSLLLNEAAVSPDVVLMLALVGLQLAGVISVRELLAGFANEGIATVGSLYIVALAVSNSGALDLVSRYVLGAPTSTSVAVARLMVPTSVLSAFINNTPIVAMMAPVVVSWAQRVNVPASKLLIPLSFASILGGTTTLIGTSTNLIVKALAVARDPAIDLTLFGIAAVGVPMALLGVAYMALLGHRLLPVRESPSQAFRQDERAYSAHVVIRADAQQLIGRSLGEAGLRHLTGLFVYSVARPATNELFDAPASDFVLQAGDVIAVAGDVKHVSRLWCVDGLELHHDDVHKLRRGSDDRRHHLVEVVVAQRSPLVGRTPRQVKFRSRFNAAIVGVHRHGEHVVARIGDVVLEGGDVLLLVTAGAHFATARRHASLFAFVSEAGVAPLRAPLDWRRIAFVVTLTLVMLVVASVEQTGLSLFTVSLALSYIFWLTGVVTVADARSSVDISVMVMTASSVGLSSAMLNSGVAMRIGTVLVHLFEPVGELGLLFGIYLTTALLTAFISNSASVSLVFPIAYVVAQNTTILNTRMVSYCLMLAGSADFMTPIGYQTNLMVYGIGNYKFLDFTRVGMPLQLVCCVVACVLCFYLYRD